MTLELDTGIRVLRLVTPISAAIAFITITIGLVTSAWLFSEEKIANPKFIRTGDPELEFLSKFTTSGLWTLCYTNPGEIERHCFNIDYFPQEEYSPDPNDSTMSIPYAVLRSAPFFFMAAAILIIGEVTCFMGHFAKRRRYCTFISGITFIISGLFLLMGFVVYVSVFTAEIGSKLRPSSSLQPPLFTYSYGYSFQLVVTGFLAVEVAGTSAVFLFIYWHRDRIQKKEMQKKMTVALVQTPIDLSQASHILPLTSQLNACNRRSVLCDSSNQCQQQYQDRHQQQYCSESCHDYPQRHFMDSQLPCNGNLNEIKQVSVCSSIDDDSCIPTPPPPSVFQRIECPIHRQLNRELSRQSMTERMVHNIGHAESYVPKYATLGRNNEQHQFTCNRLPDLTTFSRGFQRRQFSSESESCQVLQDFNSYKSPHAIDHHHQHCTAECTSQLVCHQCHGAGHVIVNTRQKQFPMPRDLTSTTVFTTVELESPDRLDDVADGQCQPQIHYGSLRRITAV